MADHDAYCETLVREADKDRFLATLFAPAQNRPALFALYAFDIEARRVASAVREPMAGEIRFQWWRDVITGEGHSGGSPVATALIEAMRAFRLPECELVDVLDAHSSILQGGHDHAADAAARAGGLIFDLAARILNDGDAPAIGRLPQIAGSVQAMSAEFRASPDPAIRRRIEAGLAEAGALLRQAPEALWPVFLTLALTPAVLKGKSLPQWRRQWILWRAARDLPKVLAQ
jgi:phytoene synthase